MPTNQLLSRLVTTGTRLVILASMIMAALTGSVMSAAAAPLRSLQSVTVGAQSGTLTYDTAGDVTFLVSVLRSGSTPSSFTLSASGLPAGASVVSPLPSTSFTFTTNPSVVTMTLHVDAGVAAGSYNFTVQASGTGPDPIGAGTLSVSKADQTITFGALADKSVGDPDFTVSATASSGLPVSFTAAGACTVTVDSVHITGSGFCWITAAQAGDANYLAAPNVTQVFTILPAAGTYTSFDLYAVGGSTALPGQTVTVWGYNSINASVTQPGGPTLDVNEGDVVVVTLHNSLSESTSILFQGQDMIPDTTGTAPGGSKVYIFTASRPGTYLYEAGLLPNAQHQVAMGLYGALIVRPDPAFASVSGANTTEDLTGTTLTDSAAAFTDLLVGGTLSNVTDGSSCTITASTATTLTCAAPLSGGTANTWAIGDAYTATAGASFAYGNVASTYNDEAVLVLSELDPALNNRANPATFDMRNYAPKYFLINGKVYPNTDPIPTAAGNQVLLRYVNAGLQAYSMSLLGLRQTAIAMDGSPFTYGRTLVAETIAPGQTADMLAGIPAAVADGTRFALFDGNLMLHNNKTNNTLVGGFGGMLTFLTAAGSPPTGDTTGPATSGVSLTPTSVSATVSDAGRGDSNVTSAEFFIDTIGADGSGTAMSGAFGTVTVSVSGVINPALSGTHTVYVHGLDAAGNWGPFQSAVISNDTTGPATSALSLSPNPSRGTVNVALSATADDRANGGSNIAAGEYTIDGGAAQAMTVSPTGAKVASLTATISAATVNALSEGAHVVSVRSQDSLGNWGDPATIDLVVDRIGPATSNVSAAPNPNNGTLGINSSTPAVRVTATFADALSNIGAGEGFIDTVGANGTGIILLPSDGLFNSPTENGYVDIPLTTIGALSDGNHTIYVHGKDAAGNWGATGTTILVIDKTAPAISSVTLTPSTIAFGAASVTLNVTASDAGTGVSGGQYWIDGTATPPANPTAFTGTSVAIDTSALAAGAHVVYVRVQDAATNWSAVSSATLDVVQAVNDALAITANGNATQTSDVTAPGLLTNDQPIGTAGRTTLIASAPVRTSGTGTGTITVTCPASLGTAATPAISGNTVCTNGAYRVTLNGVGNNNNQRAASKRGTYQFTYTLILNGVTSTATVTITVN